MGKNRFLIPAYLLNTMKIKAQAMRYRLVRGSSPYAYFLDSIHNVSTERVADLNYSDSYHSLAYFDLKSAMKYHSVGNNLVGQIIMSLVQYNDIISNEKEDHKNFLNSVKTLLEKGEFKNDCLLFFIDEDYSRFDLKGPYLSSIVQGKMISLFVRCYQLTKDKDWLDLAAKIVESYTLKIDQGGFSRILGNGMTWMEEYPSPNPSMVLNGYLFWLIGLGEFVSITKDEKLRETFNEQLSTVLNWLPAYRLDNGLLYSMYRWNPCNVHYTAIIKFQFEHLFKLTGLEIFKSYALFLDGCTNWDTFSKMTLS